MKLTEKEYITVVLDEMENMLKSSSNIKKKSEELNIMENSMWSNMIDGALKALEIVSISSFDWKLIGIVKLLQSWVKDKREEARRKEIDTQYGTGYQTDEYDPWSNTTY